jgi:hypothetical protein
VIFGSYIECPDEEEVREGGTDTVRGERGAEGGVGRGEGGAEGGEASSFMADQYNVSRDSSVRVGKEGMQEIKIIDEVM